MIRLGPAPTRSRELFAVGLSLIVVALILFILSPGLIPAGVALGIVAVFLAVRWIVGTRTVWRNQ